MRDRCWDEATDERIIQRSRHMLTGRLTGPTEFPLSSVRLSLAFSANLVLGFIQVTVGSHSRRMNGEASTPKLGDISPNSWARPQNEAVNCPNNTVYIMLLWEMVGKYQRQICKVASQGSHYVTHTYQCFVRVASGNWPHFLATPLMETFTLLHVLRQRNNNLIIVVHGINSGSPIAGAGQAVLESAWALIQLGPPMNRRAFIAVGSDETSQCFHFNAHALSLHHRDSLGVLAYCLSSCVWETVSGTLTDN
jgi:hypothetical protein